MFDEIKQLEDIEALRSDFGYESNFYLPPHREMHGRTRAGRAFGQWG